ncbi:uncharacterized protein G2W53_007626 [Senna tora]|uniref:Uncharacterized protein n=1 Tax=Senna tora TaxID=362788 RepID=A0A835CEE7_9FABA|nr:uncharacterized protein G2W53_007626 [Senna tora]
MTSHPFHAITGLIRAKSTRIPKYSAK